MIIKSVLDHESRRSMRMLIIGLMCGLAVLCICDVAFGQTCNKPGGVACPPILDIPASGSWLMWFHASDAVDYGTVNGNTISFNYVDASTGQWNGYLVAPQYPAVDLWTLANPPGYTSPRRKRILFSFSVLTTGSPAFGFMSESFNTCLSPPASIKLLVWANNFGPGVNDRWFGLYGGPQSYDLAQGSANISVALDPAKWINVNGESGMLHPAEWQAAFQNVQAVGAVHGGGCFYGHGVNVSGGTATLAITKYAVY